VLFRSISEPELRELIERLRNTLYETRSRRHWPGRDDKALAVWNGFTLRAMAEAGRVLLRPDYTRAARHNAEFLLRHMVKDREDGGVGGDGKDLLRSWRQGSAKIDAYLEDYASVVNGLLSTYETTGEVVFLSEAKALAERLLDRFWDESSSSFFDTAIGQEALIGRPRELTDGATPSGTSLAAEALLRLAAFFGEERYHEYAARVLVPLSAAMADQPSSFSHFLCALDDYLGPMYEIAIVEASPEDSGAIELERVVASHYLPRTVLAVARTPDEGSERTVVPLLRDRGLVEGRSAAYVCQNFVCRQPVTEPDDLLNLL
jgi:uncharacterized protein